MGVWRVEEKACEKPSLPMSIQEDCNESWLAVRAKDLYNSYVFPPCMKIQIVGFWLRLSPKYFHVYCALILLLMVICVQLDLVQSFSFRKLIVEVGYSILLWSCCIIGLIYSQILYIGLRERFVDNLQNLYMVSKLVYLYKFLHGIRAKFVEICTWYQISIRGCF